MFYFLCKYTVVTLYKVYNVSQIPVNYPIKHKYKQPVASLQTSTPHLLGTVP